MKKYSYVCAITSEAYYPGVCALAYSLKKVNAQYPLTVVVPDNAEANLFSMIKKLKLRVITMPYVDIPVEFLNDNTPERWKHTFFKLQVFNLTEFDKIVFLDLDMIIIRNIDDLFQKSHMSAVAAGHCIHDSWTRLNSGLMVIEPSVSLYNKLIQSIPAAGEERFCENLGFGDQDVINFCFPDWWKEKDLVLPEIYNAMPSAFEKICKIYGWDNVCVIHYAASRKPWNYTGLMMFAHIMFSVLKGNVNEAKMRYIYWCYVKKSCLEKM